MLKRSGKNLVHKFSLVEIYFACNAILKECCVYFVLVFKKSIFIFSKNKPR